MALKLEMVSLNTLRASFQSLLRKTRTLDVFSLQNAKSKIKKVLIYAYGLISDEVKSLTHSFLVPKTWKIINPNLFLVISGWYSIPHTLIYK